MPLSELLRIPLTALQAELPLILNAVAEGVCGVDAQGNVTFCNNALLRITGFGADEVIGQNLHQKLHAKHRDGRIYRAEDCPFCKALAGGCGFLVTGEHLWRKDGTSFPVEGWVQPLHNPRFMTAYIVTVQDISQREEAARALRQSVERVRQISERVETETRAHAVLSLEDEKYRRILASLPDVSWTADQCGRRVYINPKVEGVLGYTKQEICDGGEHLWLGRIHAEDATRVARAYRALFEERSSFDEEYRIAQKDGAWIWLHDRAIHTHTENGVLYADGLFCDVTRRKQAEIELQAKTAFLEAQANSTIDAILVIDENGKRLLHNQKMVELFRVPAEVVSDPDDRKMLEHACSLIKDRDSFFAKVQYLYRHPRETSRDEIEFTDGTFLDRYSSPVTGRDGRCYGRIWTFRDITDRKRNEDMLRQLSTAVEQSAVSVVITDPKGDISYVNRKFTEVTGYTAAEVLGKNPRVLNSGRAVPEMYRALWSTISQGREWRGEFCNRKKSGDIFWEAATITPITTAKGDITHFVAIKEDITERRVLESQLRQAQKLEGVGQLAAGIAHEINTPTQFVTDNLTFLRDSWKAAHDLLELYRETIRGLGGQMPPERAAALEQAERSCDLEFIAAEVPRAIDQGLDGARRVAKIVRAMKEFSHPDSAEKTATDLNQAIESTVTVARNEWKYVAELSTDFEENLAPVVCYAGEINQVILNLVVNAAHAIREKVPEGEKGNITVRTRARGDFVEISISDSGTGIPEDIHTRVFEPFFTTKEVGKGTGQGLALAHSVVVKKHRGKIWFETEMGRGTTFFIHLPITSSRTPKGD